MVINTKWVILSFNLAKEQSTVRVSVWRKLKKGGSISLGQSMWILPNSDDHVQFFTEIGDDVRAVEGVAYIANIEFVGASSDHDVTQLFNQIRNEEYADFSEKCEDFLYEIDKEVNRKNFTYVELEENEDEYNKLLAWLKKITLRDFFVAEKRSVAEDKLVQCEKKLSWFAEYVYKENQEN